MEKWFGAELIKWYKLNKRDLPWRQESDPYRIWLSEVILQQTQVKQGLSYYLKFIQNYPSIKHLAQAKEDKVLKDWQGLGYYSRARNLQTAAKTILKEHQGKFPKDYEHIRKLKGIGDYTAAAIASFAFGEPYAVVDGNVYRVLSRVFGLDTPIDSSAGKKEFAELAMSLIDKKNPGTYNQAIMEFGSQYCKPVNPDCSNCIFGDKCFANKNDMIQKLPVKGKKTAIQNLYFNYLVIIDKNNEVLLNKRTDKGIWQGLYEFKLIESARASNENEVFSSGEFKSMRLKKVSVLHISNTYKHILSHRHIFATFYVLKTQSVHSEKSNSVKVKLLTKFAFPQLIEKFLKDCKLSELF